jgi:hypothetical protein
MSGPKGFYVYDYRLFSVPKREDGSYMADPDWKKVNADLHHLPQSEMPY